MAADAVTFNSLSRDHGRVKDKIPADFAVGYLSTPSLGITRRDPRTTLEDILSYFDLTFNSLSRDHVVKLFTTPGFTEASAPFNSLSRDHAGQALSLQGQDAFNSLSRDHLQGL